MVDYFYMGFTGTPSLPFLSIVHSLVFFHVFSLHLSSVTASRDLKWWMKGLCGKYEPLPVFPALEVVSLVRPDGSGAWLTHAVASIASAWMQDRLGGFAHDT